MLPIVLILSLQYSDCESSICFFLSTEWCTYIMVPTRMVHLFYVRVYDLWYATILMERCFLHRKKGISGKSADFTCSICVEFENASDNRRTGQPSSISNYPPSKRNHTSSGPLEEEVVLKSLPHTYCRIRNWMKNKVSDCCLMPTQQCVRYVMVRTR